MIKELFGILGILILLIEIYLFICWYWLRRLLEKKKKGKRIRKPAVLRPKSERGNLPAIAAFARKISERGSLRSVKSQLPGHYEKAKAGRRRK